NSLESRVSQMNLFINNAIGLDAASEDSTVPFAGSGGDSIVADTSAMGGSSDSQCVGVDDYLSLKGHTVFERDDPAVTSGRRRGESVQDLPASCNKMVEHLKLSAVFDTIDAAH